MVHANEPIPGIRRGWTIVCRGQTLIAVERALPNGKLEQFQVLRAPN
jgi:hypothetical protein